MGSFNHKCNFSQLPATYGDRIVVILGVKMTENAMAADMMSLLASFSGKFYGKRSAERRKKKKIEEINKN